MNAGPGVSVEMAFQVMRQLEGLSTNVAAVGTLVGVAQVVELKLAVIGKPLDAEVTRIRFVITVRGDYVALDTSGLAEALVTNRTHIRPVA